MNFRVTFTTNNEKLMLIESLGRPGMDMLDAVREDYPEVNVLPAEKIEIGGGCLIRGYEETFYISEDLARKSSLFNTKTRVEVKVPVHFLSRFVLCNLNKYYDDVVISKGLKILDWHVLGRKVESRLNRVCTDNTFSKDALFEAWEKAGFPIDWS